MVVDQRKDDMTLKLVETIQKFPEMRFEHLSRFDFVASLTNCSGLDIHARIETYFFPDTLVRSCWSKIHISVDPCSAAVCVWRCSNEFSNSFSVIAWVASEPR